jgi:hypothetical protein
VDRLREINGDNHMITRILAFGALVALGTSSTASAQNVSVDQASSWIALHLPSGYITRGAGESLVYPATFTPRGCSISASILLHTYLVPENTNADTDVVYDLVGGPVPGQQFPDGAIPFKLLDPSSLVIQPSQQYLGGTHLGPNGFSFTFNEQSDANRMLRAMKYLATKCGAKASPF